MTYKNCEFIFVLSEYNITITPAPGIVNSFWKKFFAYPGRKCGVHIDGLGWVPESACTVIG